MQKLSSKPNHSLLPYGPRPSIMWHGSRIGPSPAPLNLNLLHTRFILVKNPLSNCSASLVARHMLIPQKSTKVNLVNALPSVFMLGLLKKKRLTYYIAVSARNYLIQEMLSLKRLRDGRESQLTQTVRTRLLKLKLVIQRGIR